MTVRDTHISLVKQGDLILHGGEVKTLSGTYLKRCPFMGTTIWGDSYHAGHKPVKLVTSLKF